MSFFHRPGDSSSEDDSSSEEEEELSLNEVSQSSAKDSTGTAPEEVINADLNTESLSLTNTISNGEDGSSQTLDQARNIMLASMLEELSRYKAAEAMNNANVANGRVFNKNSHEVQELANDLFSRSSGILSNTGLLPTEAASDKNRNLRTQMLAAVERTAYIGISGTRHPSGDRGRSEVADGMSTALIRRPPQQPDSFQTTTSAQLGQLSWEMSNLNVVRRPSTELQLTPPAPHRMRSHYTSTFEERGLLGRGGFGRVYHTYNFLDQREYAIKKIPLSPKLSQKYLQGGHQELAHVLREVQALARLDHCNVVRYHATWIEEPNALPVSRPQVVRQQMLSHRGQLLLDNRPAMQNSPRGRILAAKSEEAEDSQDPFERSRNDQNYSKQLWSNAQTPTPSISQFGDDNAFSDGRSRNHPPLSHVSHLNDPSVYVLHVQMSMYPTTLSEYLLPARPVSKPNSPRSKNRSNSTSRFSITEKPRHCFHLIPALRLLLAILSGLQYIHSQGFIHRDIKPSNIFLTTLNFASPTAFSEGYADIGSCPTCLNAPPRFMNPRIGDFGLVADLERAAGGGGFGHSKSDSSESSSKVVGTEYYRPPNHKFNRQPDVVDEKIDVFALGVILLELLWSCGTRMERVDLLQGCQKGRIPEGLRGKVKSDSHDDEVVDMLESCVYGMIDPNPHTRWRCGMVKSGIEGILNKISTSSSREQQMPD